MNAIQVLINENIRMLGKLKERWAREKEEEERVLMLEQVPLLCPKECMICLI